jgi:hypothetical protein
MVVQQHHKILGFVNFANRKTIGLPSWAVDFETVVKMTDLEIGTSYLTFLGPGAPGKRKYISYSHASQHSLYIKGHECGSVADVIPLQSLAREARVGTFMAQGNSVQRSASFKYADQHSEFVQRAECAAAESIAITGADNLAKPGVSLLKKLARDFEKANVEPLKAKM